jgi:hypothetical protein
MAPGVMWPPCMDGGTPGVGLVGVGAGGKR